jgi:dTDP-4-dehydrorhamnose 3,5-epimerase
MAQRKPSKDVQTVDRERRSIAPRIHGVTITQSPLHEDERGELSEVWTERRDPLGLPVVHVYMVSIRPGKIRGWQMHQTQTDRVFTLLGRLRIGLYDARPDSPTSGMLNVLTFSDRNRALIVFPPGVWHGIQNVGEHEAIFLNLPSRPYRYEEPDKFRLPPKNDLIPFAFEDGPGR